MATLHKKTLSIIGASLIGMILLLYLSSHFIIIDSFDRLEEQNAMKNAISLEKIMLSESGKLENKAADWSVWDETCDFVQGNDDEYIEKYLMDETFLNQELDFMLFYDNSTNQVYGKMLQSEDNISPSIIELEQYLEEENYLLKHDNISSRKTGYLVFSNSPVLLTSQPIVRSDKSGPIEGIIIMGRVIDNDKIDRLEEITSLDIQFKDIKNFNNTAKDVFSDNNTSMLVKTFNDDVHIYSYAYFNDIYGKDAFSLEIRMLRVIHQQGTNALTYFLMVFILTGIVFGSSLTYMLEKSHMSRLKKLQNEIQIIGRNKDFSKRVVFRGNDEIASLGKSVNNMLESLESSQSLIERRDKTINAILQAMPDMMFQVKKDGTIRNYKLSTDKCIYESPETELRIKLDDVLPVHIAEKQIEMIGKALETNRMQTMQYTMPVKGEMRDFEARLVVSGKDEVMVIVKDITEIKQAEEMHKKDLLLKEIHHRVKNNLQIISSLLKLQSRKFTDQETIEAFRKSQDRARSMAIAHEKIYQSYDLENIDIGNYIETLTCYLLDNYGYRPDEIKINIRIKNVTLSIDTAIPLGLIVTEIVSNALKHAFGDRQGEIHIDMIPEDEKYYMLVIRDNGVGFPENLDFMNTDSLGMQLVVSLVDQIEGTVELKRNKGTEFRIKFKELAYKRRDY